MINLSTTESWEGDGGIVWIVEEILLGRKDIVEGEGRIVVHLPIARESRSGMTGSNWGSLTVELDKSAPTLARDAFGCNISGLAECSRNGRKGLTARV